MAQAILFEAFVHEGLRLGWHSDWVPSNQWLAERKFNMTVEFPDGAMYSVPTSWHVKQGKYSGTRGTDLMNTLLNFAYFNIAQEELIELTGRFPANLYYVHQGDDVWISSTEPHVCAALYNVLNYTGLVTPSVKQMFGLTVGEYLRVLCTDGSAKSYLVRALANLILKEVQSPIYSDSVNMVPALYDSISTIARYGFHPTTVQLLADDLYPYWSKILTVDDAYRCHLIASLHRQSRSASPVHHPRMGTLHHSRGSQVKNCRHPELSENRAEYLSKACGKATE